MPTLHRGEIESWDLQSLLLKPIQRVLKYPLLLNKLVETTSDNHPDYKVVHSAQEAIAKVAQDINEIKRRKDLGKWLLCVELSFIIWSSCCSTFHAVIKYTGSREDRKGSLSVHSLQKKMRRFQQTLKQFTGLGSKVNYSEYWFSYNSGLTFLQTVDPKFDEMEQKVLSLESLIRTLLKDIASWQEQLQVNLF